MTAGTYTYHGQRPRVTLEDPSAAHQIRLSASGSPVKISVSCTCQGYLHNPHEPLDEPQLVYPSQDALKIWRDHVAQAEHTA